MTFNVHKTFNNEKYDNSVSVVLPVYNGSQYLNEAIDSILAQTYKNYELIIIDDGSKDNSASIIYDYTDSRICFHKQANQGLAATLNKGISIAKGKYIARQDQDDISFPDRLAKQVAFLDKNPDYGMVGTWSEIWVDDMRTDRSHQHPADNVSLQFFLLFNNPFVHSSIMFRRDVFDIVGLYCTDKSRQPPEDYELWSRIAREFDVANIPEILHAYREISGSMSRDGVNPFLEKVVNIAAENLSWVTNENRFEPAVRDLAALANGALHLVSKRPCIKEITCLLGRAAEKVCSRAGKNACPIEDDAETRLRLVRNQYLFHRFGQTIGNALAFFDSLYQTRRR
jgi:glycosyltransferase involved in cell wall biosynthesis